MNQPSHHIVFNASSGTALAGGITAEVLVERFMAMGFNVSLDADAGRPFEARMATARNSAAPIIVAAGGDGTVTALAEVAIQSGKTLAVLPLGTANLLARDLALPLTIDEWFAQYPQMPHRHIDVGEVNGRIFLHKVVIGNIPGIAAGREALRGRSDLRAKLAMASYLMRRLARSRRFAAEVTPGHGEARIDRVQSIAVVNNDYDEGLGRIFARSHLDDGMLGLYLLHQLSVGDAFRLALRMLVGNWRSDEALEIEKVRSVVIRTRRKRVRVMMDGELRMFDGPLSFRTRPMALSVVAPAAVEEVAEEAVLKAS